MDEAQPQDDTTTEIAPRPVNADGKGANALLADWQESAPRGVVAKPRHQVLAELFTSLLVLSARFGYKPAVGVANYLYLVNGEWVLSLIAPEEWPEDRSESCAGTCVLQPDRTWTISPSPQLGRDTPVAEAMSRFYQAFAGSLDADGVLEDLLPFHAGELSYYPRMNANALSRSIRATVTLGDQRTIPVREWRLALPGTDGVLLPWLAADSRDAR